MRPCEGRTADGSLRRLEDARVIRPCLRIGARTLKAIQATTAAGLAESAHLLLRGDCKGRLHLQSQIDPPEFMHGPFVSTIYGAFDVRAAIGGPITASGRLCARFHAAWMRMWKNPRFGSRLSSPCHPRRRS